MDILPKDLLAKIDKFLAERNMSSTSFGKLAVNDGHFVRRLREGANMKIGTIARVHEFLQSQTSNRSDAA